MVASAKTVAAAIDAAGRRSITPVAVNRTVHSCWTDGKDLTVIFTDLTEMVISWGNRHAELRGRKTLTALPSAPILQGPVSRILAGKVVSYCYLNDDDELVIRTACGHEAVIGYDNEPVIRRMDVKSLIEPLPGLGAFLGT